MQKNHDNGVTLSAEEVRSLSKLVSYGREKGEEKCEQSEGAISSGYWRRVANHCRS